MVIDFVNLFVTRIDAIEYKSLFAAAETMYNADGAAWASSVENFTSA